MVEILSGVINKRRAKKASAGATEENEERTDLLQVRLHRHTCASPRGRCFVRRGRREGVDCELRFQDSMLASVLADQRKH